MGRLSSAAQGGCMHPRFKVPMFAAALLVCCNQAAAQTGPYIQMDLGLAVAPPLAVHGSNNDWGTKCDLLINPLGVEVGNECDTAPPRAAWLNELGGAPGIRTGFAVGYDWGAVRLEAEYFHRLTPYNERTDTGTETAVILAKREQEIAVAEGGVDDLRSHNFFGNVYYDFGSASTSWTPYVGAGVGLERASLDYFSLWKRNHDPERITT
ncbi:MAG: P44/Msp2 family outer membrane protein, partial [Acidobacteria bacterium]|nr:P44/Msp2 family outer membrane protein [Acidobacteriota bacterium]